MPSPLRVLHLENSPRDAELIRQKLDEGGLSCDVLLVDSKNSFEAALAQEPFDLILCDYNLPGYDGVSALTYAQEARPDVPVILISGTLGDEEAVRCLHLGATDYLLKDHLERLAPAVKRALQEAEARRTRRLTEERLRQSELLNRSLVEHLPQRMLVKDLKSNYVFCNAIYARDLGIEPAQIVGQDDFAFFSRELAEGYQADDRQVMADGQTKIQDERYTVAGEERWVHTVKVPYRNEHGEIIGVLGLLEDISEHRRADAERERLAALVDASPDFIGYADPKGTIINYINQGGRKMCGIGADEDIGTLEFGDVHPAWMNQLLAEVALPTAVRDGLWQGDGAFLHRDGHEIPVSMALFAHRGADGEVDFFYTVSHDITERKRAELTLRDERDRAQQYLDTAQVILLKLDMDGRIALVNRYGCSVLGWPADELLGRNWFDTCIPTRVRDVVRKRFIDVLGGDCSVVETSILTKSGGERLIEWRSTVTRDDEERVVGTFSSGTDVTERNQAVESLRTAEERTQFVLQNANVGVWDMDYTTGVLRWSGTLEAQYGLAPGTFGGTFEAFVDSIHPDDWTSVLDIVNKAMVAGTDFSVLNRAVWPDGTVRWLSGAGRFLLGERGEPVRGVGISQDVTERRSLEQQFQQAQKMEAVGQLAGGVAHDFNNLLTVILGFCELLLADFDSTDPRQADITEIQKAGTRAAGLTRQLLAFSRKQIIEPTRLDLNVVVTEMQPMLRRLIREDVLVVLGLRPGLALVKADRGEIEQVVMNLAVNARDAMPKGGTLTIETANVELDEHYAKTHVAVTPGPYVVLTVTDTGTGMTPQVQARLFEPFFTTKEPGKGTGLGMATVYGIVTRTGGSVGVDSEVGRGTSFKVYFPRTDVAETFVDAPALHARPSAGTLTVLLVEDEEGLRELAKRLLLRQGYTVLAAADAAAAIRLFDENPSIDVLLTDVVMPGASGPELVRQLVARRPALKVIYMSGYTDDAIVQHGVLNPGIAFLHKPFTSETLGRKIRDVLDR